MSAALRYVLLCLVVSSIPAFTQQTVLTNSSVVKMVRAGLGDDLVVQSINSQPALFNTSADDLIALKRAGVSTRVLAAMLSKISAATPAAARTLLPVAPAASLVAAPLNAAAATSTGLPAGVDDMGVYYRNRDGRWEPMRPEILNLKTGGVLKTLATDGIIKGDLNVHLTGAESKLAVDRRTEFLLYAPDGTAAEEYQLLKLRVNSKNREFRSATGGIFHASTGAHRDLIDFNAKKIGPHMYEFGLPLDFSDGEYGILPPGSMSSVNVASAGKIYTFHLAR